MPRSFVKSTPLPVRIRAKRSLSGAIQRGRIQAGKLYAIERTGGVAPRAGDQRQLAGSLRPDAKIVREIDSAAGQVGTKRKLAGVV